MLPRVAVRALETKACSRFFFYFLWLFEVVWPLSAATAQQSQQGRRTPGHSRGLQRLVDDAKWTVTSFGGRLVQHGVFSTSLCHDCELGRKPKTIQTKNGHYLLLTAHVLHRCLWYSRAKHWEPVVKLFRDGPAIQLENPAGCPRPQRALFLWRARSCWSPRFVLMRPWPRFKEQVSTQNTPNL